MKGVGFEGCRLFSHKPEARSRNHIGFCGSDLSLVFVRCVWSFTAAQCAKSSDRGDTDRATSCLRRGLFARTCQCKLNLCRLVGVLDIPIPSKAEMQTAFLLESTCPTSCTDGLVYFCEPWSFPRRRPGHSETQLQLSG